MYLLSSANGEQGSSRAHPLQRARSADCKARATATNNTHTHTRAIGRVRLRCTRTGISGSASCDDGDDGDVQHRTWTALSTALSTSSLRTNVSDSRTSEISRPVRQQDTPSLSSSSSSSPSLAFHHLSWILSHADEIVLFERCRSRRSGTRRIRQALRSSASSQRARDFLAAEEAEGTSRTHVRSQRVISRG